MTQSAKMKKCWSCGVAIRETANNCTDCGKPQPQGTTMHSEPTLPLGNSSMPIPTPNTHSPAQLAQQPRKPNVIPLSPLAPTQVYSPVSSPSVPTGNGTTAASTSPVSPSVIILPPPNALGGQNLSNATKIEATVAQTPPPQTATSSIEDIINSLNKLISGAQNGGIEQYFPGNLPNKSFMLANWEKQLRQARDSATELQRPEYSRVDTQQYAEICRHLNEATRILDYEREYTVKLIGSTGAGKSTLMATLIGQDIFPRQTGKAITAVPTHVRICEDQDNEEMCVHFFSRQDSVTFWTQLWNVAKIPYG